MAHFFITIMKGVIVNFRGSRRVKKMNQMIIEVDGVSSKDKAKELVGKSVEWKTPSGKVIKGKVSSEHGNSGAIRAIFESGMPGQSMSGKVSIN